MRAAMKKARAARKAKKELPPREKCKDAATTLDSSEPPSSKSTQTAGLALITMLIRKTRGRSNLGLPSSHVTRTAPKRRVSFGTYETGTGIIMEQI